MVIVVVERISKKEKGKGKIFSEILLESLYIRQPKSIL